VGRILPGTVLGAVLIQMVWVGLVVAQVDLYLHPLVASAIIFLAVFLDSVRNTLLTRLARPALSEVEWAATSAAKICTGLAVLGIDN
jgi:hypothetical protein